MNKKIIIIFIVFFVLIIGIITFVILENRHINEIQINNTSNENNINIQTNDENNNYIYNENTNNIKQSRLKITIDDGIIFVNMEDNKTSKDFIELLPLTLKMEDYNKTEKIATLPQKLSTEDAPSGYDPKIGDLCYYAPWGNICFYYNDYTYSNSLIKLGELENKIEILEKYKENFSITIELEK